MEKELFLVRGNAGEYPLCLRWEVMAYTKRWMAEEHVKRLDNFFDKMIELGKSEGLTEQESMRKLELRLEMCKKPFKLDPMVSFVDGFRPRYKIESRMIKVGEDEKDIPNLK